MKRSLNILAAVVAISLCRQTSAAIFPIADGDVTSLIMAINTSNTDTQEDTIELATNGAYTLTAVDNSTNGPNGLPVIGSDTGHTLVIHGNGATLQRSSAGGTPAFRIFQIGAGADVTISGLTITNGHVTDNFGGGIDNVGTLTVTNSTLSGNSASAGGGVYNQLGTVTVTNSTISGNSTLSIPGFGGGIYNIGTLTVTNSTLSGNSASFGGGIENNGSNGSATLTITNSTLSGNSASFGGGIENFGQNSGSATLTVTNSTISGNSAIDSGGGGIENFGENSGSATLTVTNSTISGNSAASAGGGIFNIGVSGSATLTISDTVLNAGATGANVQNDFGTVTSLGYNLSSDNGGGFLTATGDQINTAPMLGPLQDNGGPTFTHALLVGSPAINAGNPTFMPPSNYDQRGPGFDRVVNGRIDIGAFEVQATPSPTPTPTPTATATATPTPTPTVAAQEAYVTVSKSSVPKGKKAAFIVHLAGPAAQPVTVHYSMSGGAILGTDYTLSGTPGQVTIPAGQSAARVILHARRNVKKNATMTLTPGPGYFLSGLADDVATIRIKKK